MKEFSLTSGELDVRLPSGGRARVKYYTRALIYTIDNEIAAAAIEQLRSADDAGRGPGRDDRAGSVDPAADRAAEV